MKKAVSLVIALAIVFTMAMGVSFADESADKLTLDAICVSWDVNPPMEDWWIWDAYEKMTNIHINWTEVPSSTASEKKTTIIASEDLPDFFWQFTTFSVPELYQYGSEGLFVAINEYPDYMPNLEAQMEGNSSIRPTITMPDGNIYAFPYIMDDPWAASCRYYINRDWLNNLGLEKPDTLEDLEAVLAAFKAEDANGNGDTEDEYPIMYPSGSFDWLLERSMMGSFGMGSKGSYPIQNKVYVDEDGELKFIYTDEKLKEMWQMFAEWWQKGYFHPETFSGYDYAAWVTEGSVNDTVGMFSWAGANYLYNDAINHYTAVHAFKGPYSQDLCWIEPAARGVTNGIITTKNEHIPETMQWLDYFYGDEGMMFGRFGIEGETYTRDADGKILYCDEIANYDGGVQLGAFQYGLLVYGGYYPYAEHAQAWQIENVVQTSDNELSAGCFTLDELYEHIPDELIPNFVALDDEQEILDMYAGDIDAMIKEYRVKFVTGELNFDSDWDEYVTKLEGLGLDQFMEVRKAEYERYLKSK